MNNIKIGDLLAGFAADKPTVMKQPVVKEAEEAKDFLIKNAAVQNETVLMLKVILASERAKEDEEVAKKVREGKEVKEIKCAHCGKLFNPREMCFHDLCNSCFDNFNDQKMDGRLRSVGLIKGGIIPYFESAKQWSQAKKAKDLYDKINHPEAILIISSKP